MKKGETTPAGSLETVIETTGDVEQPKTYPAEEYEKLLRDKQGLEKAVSEKAEQVRRLEVSRNDWQGELKSMREDVTQQIQLFAALQAEGRPTEEIDELSPKEKGDYLKKIKMMQAEQQAKRQQEELWQLSEQYRKRAEAIGLTRKDKIYRDIFRDFRDGFHSEADEQLTELEAKKVESKPDKEE